MPFLLRAPRSRARPITVRVSPAATISVAMVISRSDGAPVRGSSPAPRKKTEVDVVEGTVLVVADPPIPGTAVLDVDAGRCVEEVEDEDVDVVEAEADRSVV